MEPSLMTRSEIISFLMLVQQENEEAVNKMLITHFKDVMEQLISQIDNPREIAYAALAIGIGAGALSMMKGDRQ